MEQSDNSGARTHRRVMAAALLLATFLAGAASGYFLAHSHTPPAEGMEDGRIRILLPDSLPPAFLQLNLSADQRTRVIGILTRARPKTDSTLRDVIPRLRALTDSVDQEIRAVLRPEQRERLAAMRHGGEPLLLLKGAPSTQGVSHVDTIVPRSR